MKNNHFMQENCDPMDKHYYIIRDMARAAVITAMYTAYAIVKIFAKHPEILIRHFSPEEMHSKAFLEEVARIEDQQEKMIETLNDLDDLWENEETPVIKKDDFNKLRTIIRNQNTDIIYINKSGYFLVYEKDSGEDD